MRVTAGRRLFVIFLAGWLALLPVATLQAAPIARNYTFGECSRIEQGAIQRELSSLIRASLLGEPDGPDYDALVAEVWETAGASAVFDQAVDDAVARVRTEEDYVQRLWSAWSSDKAAELARRVAEYAFEDPAVTAKLNEVSELLAQALISEMQANMARSASSALLCLQDYAGGRYSETLFMAFQTELSEYLTADGSSAAPTPGNISLLDVHNRGVLGAGIIGATLTWQLTQRLAQNLLQKMATRLASKIAGRILGRLVAFIPYIGWAVGIGLLAWDMLEGSQGALPQISEALKAEEVKAEMRAEIAAVLREGIAIEADTVAASLAASLIGQWQGFCAANRELCRLADENAAFRSLLNTIPVTELNTVSRWLELLRQTGDAEILGQMLADGTLDALLRLPPEAQTILQETGSPVQTLAWGKLAGPSLPQVIEHRLHRWIDPAALTPLSLAAIVAIGDNGQIHKLWRLEPTELVELLALPPADLPTIVAGASEQELRWLAGYLAELPATEVAAVGAALAQGTQTVAQLQAPPTATVTATIPATVAQIGPAGPTAFASAPGEGAADRWRWPDNGILPAALVLVLLLVGAGFGLALRREARHATDGAAGELPRADQGISPGSVDRGGA